MSLSGTLDLFIDLTKIKMGHKGLKLINIDLYIAGTFQITANRVFIKYEKKNIVHEIECGIYWKSTMKHRIIGFGLKNISCLFHIISHDSNWKISLKEKCHQSLLHLKAIYIY